VIIKIRPQMLVALIGLTIMGIVAMYWNYDEVAIGCMAGIIAVSKDIISDKD